MITIPSPATNLGPMSSPRLDSLTFMALDTETTGFGPGRNRVLEFGAVVFRLPLGYAHLEVVDRFQLVVDPGVPIEEGASKIHGITADVLAYLRAPNLDGAGWISWTEFVGRHRDAVGLAHRWPFDRGFLEAEAIRQGVLDGGAAWPKTMVCTQIFAEYIRGKGKDLNTLDTLARDYSTELPDRTYHRASEDAFRLACVFRGILLKWPTRFVEMRDLQATGAVIA